MKKFLSLVLSLVMAMSLVTVSAGAKDDDKGFTDASDINYKEAVDVMSGIGIISGYRDDSFRPDGALTRGAAAKIISYLNLGTKTADVLSCTTAPYTDVKPSDTFAPYIAYVKNAKICDGYTDGTFRAGAPLTGFAFNKMLLTSLGYSSEVEEFTGANWSVAVAKLAVKIGLTDGNDDFTGLDTCTREEACLYALNTLQATEVEYDNEGSVITAGDVKIVNKASSAEKVTTNNKDGKNIDAEKNSDGEYYLEFAEDHYDDLKLDDDDTDDFGAPSNTWTYKDKDIGTYAKSADYEFTTTADGDTNKEKLEDMDLDEYDVLDDATCYINGKSNDDFENDTNKELKKLDKDSELGGKLVNLLGKGRLVKVYTDDQTIEHIAVIDTYLAEITSISSASDKVTLDAKQDGVKIDKVDDDNDFYAELSDMDEDDLVLVTLADGEVKSVAIPETEKGTISRVSLNSDEKCNGLTFDGTKYKLSKQATSFSEDMEIKADHDSTLYIDTYGFAIWIDDINEDNDYMVAIKEYSSINHDDEIVKSVKGYDMEGNKIDLKDVKDRFATGTVYNYETDDGQYVLEDDNRIVFKPDYDMDASDVRIGTHYFDDDVKFIFLGKDSAGDDAEYDMNDVTVEEDAQDVTADIQYVLDDEKKVDLEDQKIIAVVIDAESDNATGDDVAYISEVNGSDKIDGDEADVYTLYIEGNEVEEVVSTDTGLKAHTFVTYAKNDDDTYDLDKYEMNENHSTDDTAVVIKAEVKEVPTEKVMSLNAIDPFESAELEDLNCKNAEVIDLTDEDDIGNMTDLKDEFDDNNEIVVSIVFNGDSDDDDYKTVSYIFVTKNKDNGGHHDGGDDDTTAAKVSAVELTKDGKVTVTLDKNAIEDMDIKVTLEANDGTTSTVTITIAKGEKTNNKTVALTAGKTYTASYGDIDSGDPVAPVVEHNEFVKFDFVNSEILVANEDNDADRKQAAVDELKAQGFEVAKKFDGKLKITNEDGDVLDDVAVTAAYTVTTADGKLIGFNKKEGTVSIGKLAEAAKGTGYMTITQDEEGKDVYVYTKYEDEAKNTVITMGEADVVISAGYVKVADATLTNYTITNTVEDQVVISDVSYAPVGSTITYKVVNDKEITAKTTLSVAAQKDITTVVDGKGEFAKGTEAGKGSVTLTVKIDKDAVEDVEASTINDAECYDLTMPAAEKLTIQGVANEAVHFADDAIVWTLNGEEISAEDVQNFTAGDKLVATVKISSVDVGTAFTLTGTSASAFESVAVATTYGSDVDTETAGTVKFSAANIYKEGTLVFSFNIAGAASADIASDALVTIG